jgi:hypothetical protein
LLMEKQMKKQGQWCMMETALFCNRAFFYKELRILICIPTNSQLVMERSYHPESSGSRPITEDKLGWARSVLR